MIPMDKPLLVSPASRRPRRGLLSLSGVYCSDLYQ